VIRRVKYLNPTLRANYIYSNIGVHYYDNVELLDGGKFLTPNQPNSLLCSSAESRKYSPEPIVGGIVYSTITILF